MSKGWRLFGFMLLTWIPQLCFHPVGLLSYLGDIIEWLA
jgi:hypothetical protein